jgi:hypothetical protein
MRYQVGQQLLAQFVNYVPKGTGVNLRLNPNPFPWSDELTAIKLAVLEVTEHHLVPWDQDPEGKRDCHGYVLRTVSSNFKVPPSLMWYNQFPRAAYGQASTDNDTRFSIGAFDPESVGKDRDIQKLLAMEEQLSGQRPFFWRMRDAEDFIQSLHYAERDLEEKHAQMLMWYRMALQEAYRDEAGFATSLRDLNEEKDQAPYFVAHMERTAPNTPFSMSAQELAAKVQAYLVEKRKEVGL